MLNHIATLLTLGLFGAGARLLFELFGYGPPRGPHREEPWTTKEIGERAGALRADGRDLSLLQLTSPTK